MYYEGIIPLPLTLSAKIFFCAVKEYYEMCQKTQKETNEENLYLKNYRIFIIELTYFLKNNKLYNSVITADELRIYSSMFEKKDMKLLDKTMKGWSFVLENIENEYYLKRLKEHIQNLDIYN